MIRKDNQEQCQNILFQLQKDINNILKKVENKILIPELDLRNEHIQQELAKQIALLQRLGEYISRIQKRRWNNIPDCLTLESKLNAANLAVCFLLMGNTENIILAKNIRYDIEYFLNRKKFLGFSINLFTRSLRELPTPTKVLLGLTCAFPIYTVSLLGLGVFANIATACEQNLAPCPFPSQNSNSDSPSLKENTAQKVPKPERWANYKLITMVALAGAFGSIVSILIRLQDYKDRDEYRGSITPIIVGFAKPLIGTAFGVFVFAVISSKIISFPLIESFLKESDQNYYFFFSMAFIVGFSERLDNDIVERVGGGFGLQKSAEKIREEVHQSTEDIHQATDYVRSTAPEFKEMVQDARQILPEVKEVVEDIKDSTTNESAIAASESSQEHSSQTEPSDRKPA
jgi:hypothetical protein